MCDFLICLSLFSLMCGVLQKCVCQCVLVLLNFHLQSNFGCNSTEVKA